MGTNTTGGTNDRAGNVNRRELAVDRGASEAEIQAKRMENGYGDAVFTAVEMATSKDNVIEVDDSNASSGDTSNSGSKTSKYIIVGNSMIMKFRNRIQDIINGVTLKIKGDKEKEEKSTVKKKVVKKVVKKEPKTAEENGLDEK